MYRSLPILVPLVNDSENAVSTKSIAIACLSLLPLTAGAVDATASKQGGVGGVDDGVDAQGRDVGDDDFQPDAADLLHQATVETGTPLSAKSCCNSPAWNISRMMSQPPTNSPFT